MADKVNKKKIPNNVPTSGKVEMVGKMPSNFFKKSYLPEENIKTNVKKS